MAKLSREITGKVRSCLFVLSALSVQGPRVARLLQQKLKPRLEAGDEPSSFLAQIKNLSRLLKAALDHEVEHRESGKQQDSDKERIHAVALRL